MDEAKLRAWRAHRQGLDGTLAGKTPADILQSTGWARSVGGAAPYLTLFSRGGVGRGQADKAVAQLEIHELPAARGCTYVVPAADFALALKVGQGFGDETKTAYKLGVTEAEIEKLCNAVVSALSTGPLDPEQLKEAAGGAVRNLGEEGKKKGLTSTLPVALGRLQSAGEIRRLPTNGRLDQQRYRYALWRPNPLDKFSLSKEQAFVELARRYFCWIGPASIQEFQWFSGLGVKDAKAAVASLSLAPLAPGDARLCLPRDRDQFESFKADRQPHYMLVSSLDNIHHLRRDVRTLLASEDLDKSVFTEKGPKTAAGLTDLPSHAIFDRGRLIGLWEFDTETESIAWMSFVPKTKALESAVRQTQDYIRVDLGDARSFSLDSPKSRAPRIGAIRKSQKSE